MPYRIIFDAYHVYHLPQFEPVVDLMADDPRFDVYLTSATDNLPKEKALSQQIFKSKGIPVIQANDETERAAQIRELKPDVFICGSSRYPIQDFVNLETLVGMIYHGIGVKPSYWRDNNERLDIRFVEGPFRVQQLRGKGIMTDLVLVGFPKIDPLYNGKIGDQRSVLLNLGLDPDKKTVLYAPTFYPSSFESFGMKLPKLTAGYNLIIKLHPLSYFMEKFGDVNLRQHVKLIEKIRDNYPDVKVIEPEHYNIVDLYRAADVLVTEASSTIYEIMPERKNVIICDFYKKKLSHRIFPKRIFTHRLDSEMCFSMTNFCYHITQPSDLTQALRRCFNEPDPFSELREKYIKDMLYLTDGHASERIRNEIINRMEAK